MSKQSWRDKLDPELNRKLEKLLWKVIEHEKSYNDAKDKGRAQIWVALAEVYDKLDRIEKKIDEEIENKSGQVNSSENGSKTSEDHSPEEIDEVLRDSLISY